MFNDKTIVAVGCSHTFGSYGPFVSLNDPVDKINECHNRSWVKKLEQQGQFKNSVNLAGPGGSNARSIRVLLDYLKTLDSAQYKDLIVIVQLTELSRFEVPFLGNDPVTMGSWVFNSINPVTISTKEKTFLDTYYADYYNDDYSLNILYHSIVLLHSFLKTMNITHYFFDFFSDRSYTGINNHAKEFNLTIPQIMFKDRITNLQGCSGGSYVSSNRYKVGDCGHFDHEANEFLAKYILNAIQGD
jgi:hypothetical protein